MQRIVIHKGSIGLVFRNGKFSRMITEGTYWIFPFEMVFQLDEDQPNDSKPVSDAWIEKRVQAINRSLLSN